MNIGAEIKRLREAREMSALQLAQKAGVPASMLCRLELSKSPNPCWQTVEKILAAMHVEIVTRPV
jgi:transcriptional regulator with XRE-family HTH domain